MLFAALEQNPSFRFVGCVIMLQLCEESLPLIHFFSLLTVSVGGNSNLSASNSKEKKAITEIIVIETFCSTLKDIL